VSAAVSIAPDGPEPAAPEHVRGVYRQGASWIVDVFQPAGPQKRMYYRSREEAVAARRASEVHRRRGRPVSSAPKPKPAPRPPTATDDDAIPIPTIDSPPVGDLERGGSNYVPLSERALIRDPYPLPPMPAGWRYDIYGGGRRPISMLSPKMRDLLPLPAGVAAPVGPPVDAPAVEGPAAPAPRLDAATIERLAREIGPRQISAAARAWKRGPRAQAAAPWPRAKIK
jgi:hypothetical protein